MSKIKFGDEAREELRKGFELVQKAVSKTMGPSGRFTAKKHGEAIVTTKDGWYTAREIIAEDAFQNMGCTFAKNAAVKTAMNAGDGTSATIVIGYYLVKHAIAAVKAGECPVKISNQIGEAVDAIADNLTWESHGKKMTKEMITQVATISANNDEATGKLVAEIMEVVGEDGIVDIDESISPVDKINIVEGMQFKGNLVTRDFITNHTKLISEIENPFILLTERGIGKMTDLHSTLELCNKKKRQLVVIAPAIEGEALSVMVENFKERKFHFVPIIAPESGDIQRQIMEDIAVFVGGKLVSAGSEGILKRMDENYLGTAKKVSAGPLFGTIIGGDSRPGAVEKRIEDLKYQIEEEQRPLLKIHLEKRLGALKQSAASVLVGANTMSEMREKKDRVEDAVAAVRSGLKEGVLPGGGMGYYKTCRDIVSDVKPGIGKGLVLNSLEQPLKQILSNAGLEFDSDKINDFKPDHGLNILNGKEGDMYEMGVLDPIKVVKQAVINAASIARQLILTETIIK